MMSMLHAEGTNKKRLSMPFHLNFPFSISKKNKTSRYYDVNFTASLFKRRPTLIDRRELPRELEKQVRWSSLLLAERIFVENQRALIRARILEARESAPAASERPADLRARQIAEVAVAPASEGPEQAVDTANRVSSTTSSPATPSAESFYTGPTSAQPSTKSVKPNEPVHAHVAKSTADIQTAPENSKEPAAKASPKKVYKSKFTELGSDDDEYPAVIIDDNGVPRAMSEDEITHYNLKLQAAAIEKPLAGAYLSRRRHTCNHKSNQTKHKKASLWSWKSFLAEDNGKGKSKLSWKMPVFGFAKKKDAVAREHPCTCPHH